jgi:hypothetical protein
VYSSPIFLQLSPGGNCCKELLFALVSFFDHHSVCNLLRRTVLDSKPTVRQLFNLILSDSKNLSAIRKNR